MSRVLGLHHITGIAGPPQQNLDFYTQILGLRLVKQTVNFDAPSVYHLYYADALGQPGSTLTFFPWPNASKGRVGRGQTAATTFSIPSDSLDWWKEHLETSGVPYSDASYFGEPVLRFADPDGLPLELIASNRPVRSDPWTRGPVPEEAAIRSFHTAPLLLENAEPTTRLLTEIMGFEQRAEENGRIRFEAANDDQRAPYVDIIVNPDAPRGGQGAGTIHHIAFRLANEEAQEEMREQLIQANFRPSPVTNRHYFKSVYFQTPGGILFELSTDGPGFLIDQDPEELGRQFTLPPWLEDQRSDILASLPELQTPYDREESN